jgi:ArsR family transcriptional regulator, cadmium/lead-responsive transcriptional repressor
LRRRGNKVAGAAAVLYHHNLILEWCSVTETVPFVLPEAPARTDLVAKYFRALADPNRLRILELLRDEEELRVGELVERTGLTQPNVSNHLACLRWCGFVAARRDHRVAFYSIADERVEQLLRLGHALLADNAEHVATCFQIETR